MIIKVDCFYQLLYFRHPKPIDIIMKQHLFILSIAISLTACSDMSTSDSANISVVAEGIPPGAETSVYEDNADISNVILRSGNAIIEEGDLLKSEKTGSWATYNDKGQVETISGYLNGKKQGVSLKLDNQGRVEEKTYYHNGLKHGIHLKYKYNKVTEEIPYKNGKMHGQVKKYYTDGKIMEESNYEDGVLHGLAKWYDQEGNVTIEYEYDEGKLVKQ